MVFWFSFMLVITPMFFIFKKYASFVPWVALTLISGFRYRVGTDYGAYVRIFTEKLSPLNMKGGFLWLIDIVDMVGGNYQLMFFIMSCLTMWFFYKGFNFFCGDNKTYFMLASLLFIPVCYFFSLSTIRQMLSVAIFFYAIKHIVHKEALKYFIFIFIAVLFHKSAIILFPLYWLLNIKYNRLILFGFVVIGVFMLIYSPVDFIMKLFLNNNLPYKYYFISEIFSKAEVSQATLLKLSIMSVLLVFFVNFLNRNIKIENIVFNGLIFFTLLKIVSLDMHVLSRLSGYFSPFFIMFAIFVMGATIQKVKPLKNILFVLLLLFIFILTAYGIYHKGSVYVRYNHYAINLCLFDEPCPIQISGVMP